MKTLTILLVITSTVILQTGCNNSKEKLDEAKIASAKSDSLLKIADANYQNDLKNYRIEKYNEIIENEKKIAEYKALKQETKTDLNAKIDSIEKSNLQLKLKMDNFKDEGIEDWKKFKSEFSRDMDELGKAIKDITIKNNK